ncbi:MAG: glucan biosynthesis protein [Pseudomonadota bacterium]
MATSKRFYSFFYKWFSTWVLGAVLAGLGNLAPAAPVTDPQAQSMEAPNRFGFVDVRRRAAQLAEESYSPVSEQLPDVLKDLNYDKFRDIRFRKDHTLWQGQNLPFVMRFFHRGFLFKRRIQVNVVENGELKPLIYSPDMFDFGANTFSQSLPQDLGFAGFQIFHPLLGDETYNEIAVFLGASYFRAVGAHQSWGLSARGLAIDTGLPQGEEFPYFREFWVEKPDRDATALTLYALLDSPSVTGAYRFLIQPGAETVIDVKAHVFLRKDVQKIGIAPLTSMHFHGENNERPFDDFRPEVHDSDGLAIAMGSGERLWRPLKNPWQLRISSFLDQNPKGHGLMQRDRDYDHYQDLEAQYDHRPSAWVEPQGVWGKGAIQLVEIPSDSERNDNIVAYWIPEEPAKAGMTFQFDYRVRFALDQIDKTVPGRTIATRVGGGGTDVLDSSIRKFVLDFAGSALESLGSDTKVQPVVWTSAGEIKNPVAQYNPTTKGWRVFFELTPPQPEKLVELRCFLRSGDHVLTETWSYQWLHRL